MDQKKNKKVQFSQKCKLTSICKFKQNPKLLFDIVEIEEKLDIMKEKPIGIPLKRNHTIQFKKTPAHVKMHNLREMRDFGLGSLRQTNYTSLVNGPTLFDDIKEFHGWEFLAGKIFQLPRNEKYQYVLTARSGEAENRKAK